MKERAGKMYRMLYYEIYAEVADIPSASSAQNVKKRQLSKNICALSLSLSLSLPIKGLTFDIRSRELKLNKMSSMTMREEGKKFKWPTSIGKYTIYALTLNWLFYAKCKVRTGENVSKNHSECCALT